MRVMSQPRLPNGSHALEANAASAGLALGCAYSSSDEYEAVGGADVLVFMTAFAAQYGFGAILDLWPSQGPGSYHPQAYQVAIGICITGQSLSRVWYCAGRPAADARAEIAL